MDELILYHNPRCQKSRQALKLLQGKGLEPKIVKYLEEPLSQKKLKELAQKMGIHPKEMVRTKEKLFKELGLSLDDKRSEREWIKILAENPRLLERPILEKGEKAVIGRPPERVLEIL
ncbi:MAG: arsenate reductase (glutaredoxin) [Planctomycetota bacterium]|nr:MAG: arsenate reductase (glutaredoxin) [Planctomycetota bacterium]